MNNDALEELNVAAIVLSKGEDGSARRGEEVLEKLFATVEEFQPGLVGQSGLCTVSGE